MKKNFKLLSLALSLIIALSSSTSAFAAETVEIISATETTASTYGNPIIDGALGANVIYKNSTFTFHHLNYGNAFYARKGLLSIEVKSSAPAEYADKPLVIHLYRSNRQLACLGHYHKATDSWTFTYDVPEDGSYCFFYCNAVYSGDYYDFPQTITISAVNYYPLAN